MEFSVFLADVRPSSGSKKLSLGAAQTSSGYEEAGVHHIEENPTRLCMPSHWTGETDSLEVELSKRDRSNVPTPYFHISTVSGSIRSRVGKQEYSYIKTTKPISMKAFVEDGTETCLWRILKESYLISYSYCYQDEKD